MKKVNYQVQIMNPEDRERLIQSLPGLESTILPRVGDTLLLTDSENNFHTINIFTVLHPHQKVISNGNGTFRWEKQDREGYIVRGIDTHQKYQ